MPVPGQVRTRTPRGQFILLVVVDVTVGGLVGLERTTVPLIGTDIFGLTSDPAVFTGLFVQVAGFILALALLGHRRRLLRRSTPRGHPRPSHRCASRT
ncbi:hypothetical protein AADR41_01585 [Streptomyces sp. CLV115]|uniref:hypothetical protein n=1 Tax=Streptomyces sp. CLV115 TaxID=3138502 RepID=UPI00313E190D